jgi:GxxExxY protein
LTQIAQICSCEGDNGNGYCCSIHCRYGGELDRQIDLDVRYKDLVLVGKFRADLIVNKLVLVENKASRGLTPQDEVQLLNYLKVTGIRVGLLFNFGKPSLEIVRRIV